jgi:hypothetical protein
LYDSHSTELMLNNKIVGGRGGIPIRVLRRRCDSSSFSYDGGDVIGANNTVSVFKLLSIFKLYLITYLI